MSPADSERVDDAACLQGNAPSDTGSSGRASASAATDPPGPILFYDGVCGLCDRTVQFVLRHDHRRRFRFAALQSEPAREILARYRRDPSGLDTMYLLLDAGTPTERLLDRSDGILAVLDQLGGLWRLLAAARVLPRFLRDRAYGAVARNRYQWFGRHDHCVLPPADVRARFLDGGELGQPTGERSAGPG